MHARGNFSAALRQEHEEWPRHRKQPVARNSRRFRLQSCRPSVVRQAASRHDAHMRQIIEKIQWNLRVQRTGKHERFGMRCLEVNSPARSKHSAGFGKQQSQIVQVFDQMHASDGVHRTVRPRQLLFFQIDLTKFASRREFLWRLGFIDSEKAYVRTQFSHVTECLPVRCAQIQQGTSIRSCSHKTRARIHPWKISQSCPIHSVRAQF